MNIKDKLLQTNLFIDNDKLDKYIGLINSSNTIDTSYTERHHILPRSYFKLIGQKVDNTKENIVELSYLNHILAHYYLSFCTIDKLRQANIVAFIMLVDMSLDVLTISEIEAIKQITTFAALQEEANKIKKIQCQKLGSLAKTTEHKQALCKARDLHSTTKGKKSIYNPVLNSVKFINIEELDNYLASGWVLGGKPLSAEAKEKIGLSNSIALKGKTHQTKKDNKINSGLSFNKVECIETGQIFENIIAAKEWLYKTVGIDGGQIKNCCAGSRETTGGYHWRYYKENTNEEN